MSNIIFDFDGTIADSFDYVLGFLSGEAGRATPPVGSEAKAYRGLSMKEMALKLGIPFWRLPLLYFQGRRAMRAHMEHVQAFEGVPEMLQALHKDGHKLYIVSSNSTKNIRHFLGRYHVNGYFKVVWAGAGIFGKTTLIKQLCRRYKLAASDTWYVCDELSDVIAAQAAGVRVLAVTWGFAEADALARYEPTAIARAPVDILKSF